MALYSRALSNSEVLSIQTYMTEFRGQFASASNGQSNTPSVTVSSPDDFKLAVSNAAVVNFTFATSTLYDQQYWYIYRCVLGAAAWCTSHPHFLTTCAPSSTAPRGLRSAFVLTIGERSCFFFSRASQAGQEPGYRWQKRQRSEAERPEAVRRLGDIPDHLGALGIACDAHRRRHSHHPQHQVRGQRVGPQHRHHRRHRGVPAAHDDEVGSSRERRVCGARARSLSASTREQGALLFKSATFLWASNPATSSLSRRQNCSATGSGGAIWSNSPLNLTNGAFINTVSGQSGGALYANGVVVVTGTSFSSSFAGSGTFGSGGAIYASTTATIAGSTFTNTSAALGGAVYASSSLAVTGSSFTNGAARSSGGGIYTANPITVQSTSFTGCTAQSWGGAISGADGMVLTNVSFSSSRAASYGGSVFAGNNLVVTDGTFANSSSQQNGGAIFAANNVQLQTVSVTNASAQISGGALFAGSTVTVDDSSFTRTTAGNNGGAISCGTGLTVTSSSFTTTVAAKVRFLHTGTSLMIDLKPRMPNACEALGHRDPTLPGPAQRRDRAEVCSPRLSLSTTATSPPRRPHKDLAVLSSSLVCREQSSTPPLQAVSPTRCVKSVIQRVQATASISSERRQNRVSPFCPDRFSQDGGAVFADTGSVLNVSSSQFSGCTSQTVRRV